MSRYLQPGRAFMTGTTTENTLEMDLECAYRL